MKDSPKRILLKLSGEALGENGRLFDQAMILRVGKILSDVAATGTQLGVVIGAGKKPQHRNGSLGRGITVGLRRGLVVCLRKVVRPAKVGGKANDIAHQVGRTGDICYHLILF